MYFSYVGDFLFFVFAEYQVLMLPSKVWLTSCLCRDHNVISDVKQVSLTSLPLLEVVDMSHNHLSQLENDSFPFTTNLRNV